MTTHSSDGFVPHLVDGSADYRNLGALPAVSEQCVPTEVWQP